MQADEKESKGLPTLAEIAAAKRTIKLHRILTAAFSPYIPHSAQLRERHTQTQRAWAEFSLLTKQLPEVKGE